MNEVLKRLDEQLQKEKYTGAVMVYYNCGGVRAAKFVTEEVIKFQTVLVLKST